MKPHDRWRVIGLNAFNASTNMAIDEAVAEAISLGESTPTIRFYRWLPSAVSIGYFQLINKEVDTYLCETLGIDVVRRMTGGGAVYHDDEITYSLIAPVSCFSEDIGECYRTICSRITDALASIGISSSFRPVNDVVVNGKKISGSAQTRRKGVITQHGTVLYGLDRDRMFSILKPSPSKLIGKNIKNFFDGVTCVNEECGASGEDLYRAMLGSFTFDKEWEYGDLSDEEHKTAEKLTYKYRSAEWTFSR